MKAAPSTLLRQVLSLSIPEPPAPIEIGLDEFSFRRGARFGTIIVDLRRHQVIDLLPDREAATVVRWLRAHPTIRVVSRDPSGPFAQAITVALPAAQQVLDRFHLLRNMRDVVERFLLTKRDLLRELTRSTEPAARPLLAPEAVVQQERVERWVEVYREIHTLAAKGVDITTIAQRLQVSRPLVYRYLQMTTPPSPKQPRPNPLDPFIPYILQRWNDGVRNSQLIWRELTRQGYTHSVSTVGRFVKQLRRESALPYKFKQVEAAPIYQVTQAHRPKPPSAIHVAHLILLRPDHRSQQEQEWLSRLRAADPDSNQICQLVEDFCQLVRTRQGQRLDEWVTAVTESHLPVLRSFVKSLLKEEAALRAGLTLPFSQGQIEGQIHKLKLIKRQCYGRAGFPLLRQRVLLAC
jgi:transposase